MDARPYASIRAQRLLIWLTLFLSTIYMIGFVGLMHFIPPPPADLSAAAVAALYRADPLRFKIGAIMALSCGGGTLPITLVVSVQMARLEKGFPIWATLQALAGAVGTTFFWLPILFFATAAFSADRAPELTLILHEFGWISLITPLSMFVLQFIAMAVVCFNKEEDDRYSALPRWLGYLTLWECIQACGAPMAIIFKSGIFSWSGLIPFWFPLGVYAAWLPATCYASLRGLRHQEKMAKGQAY